MKQDLHKSMKLVFKASLRKSRNRGRSVMPHKNWLVKARPSLSKKTSLVFAPVARIQCTAV